GVPEVACIRNVSVPSVALDLAFHRCSPFDGSRWARHRVPNSRLPTLLQHGDPIKRRQRLDDSRPPSGARMIEPSRSEATGLTVLISDQAAPPYAALRPLKPTRTTTFPVYQDLVDKLIQVKAHPDDTVAHV